MDQPNLNDIYELLLTVNERLTDIASHQENMQSQLNCIADRIDVIESPADEWKPLAEVYAKMGHATVDAARQALRKGTYKSGTEYQKRQQKYFINLSAIGKRFQRQQSRRVPC